MSLNETEWIHIINTWTLIEFEDVNEKNNETFT